MIYKLYAMQGKKRKPFLLCIVNNGDLADFIKRLLQTTGDFTKDSIDIICEDESECPTIASITMIGDWYDVCDLRDGPTGLSTLVIQGVF